MNIKDEIKDIIEKNDVCLFMKGTPDSPQCGFSMAVSNLLKHLKVNFKGSSVEAKIHAIDKVNDIAILKANIKPDKVYSVSNEDVSLLEDVIVAGYPLG